jgi:hypothetical protein
LYAPASTSDFSSCRSIALAVIIGPGTHILSS